MNVDEPWMIFMPLVSTRQGGKYRDLSEHAFTAAEKNWLCEEIEGIHNTLQNENEPITVTTLSNRYNIPRTTVQTWYNRRKSSHNKILHDSSGGKYPMLDSIALASMKAKNVADDISKHPWTTNDFNEAVLIGRKETAVRRENAGGPVVSARDTKMPVPNILKKIKEDEHIQMRKGQSKTDARNKACADPRMSYSWYLVQEAFASDLAAECKWNADGTTFEVKRNPAGKYYCVYVEERKNKRVEVAETNGATSLEHPIYIKWMAMTNAVGNMSPVVLIVAIDKMNEGDFIPFIVPGLSSSKVIGEFGYVIFCKSRAGNEALWRWYYSNIVISTISQSQLYYKKKVS